ncbi:hypothetical protein ASL83_003458 [Vibrio parahaemolyticus]|nr:hypothetical protein [Vibrio parahaemolyticus]
MIKTLLDRFLLRKDSTGSGQFTLEKNGEFWISEDKRSDHLDSFGQPKPVMGKTRFHDRQLYQKRKLEEAFQLVPKGVVVEWNITDGVAEFLVKERPVNFSVQQAQELISRMNTIVLESTPT